MRAALLILALLTTPAPAFEAPEGWEVRATAKDYPTLLADLKAAIRAKGLGVVTEAGPTEVARSRGIEIPGNRVVGAFNNDFAVRMLRASTPAMIEAPVRFYVTEGADGQATLAWKRPSHVFAPYANDQNAVAGIAAELDTLFASVAERAAD